MKGVRASDLSRGDGLPGRFFTSERVFEAAKRRILLQDWHCVGRADQIPAAGDLLRATVATEPVVLLRGADGRVRAFIDLCPHRGCAIFPPAISQLPGGKVICPYHGLSCDDRGRIVNAAALCGTYEGRSLIELRTDSWEGFLFVTHAPKGKDFLRTFPQLQGRFPDWRLPELVVRATADYVWEANWILVVENFSECCHCPVLHRGLAALLDPKSGTNDLVENGTLGGPMSLWPGKQSLTINGGCSQRPAIPGLNGEKQREVYFYAVFPNFFLSLHPDYVLCHIIEPLSPTRTRIRCLWMFHPSAAGIDPSDARDFWHRVNLEDQSACEAVQRNMSSRYFRPGPYFAGEGVSATFDRHFLRRMFPRLERLPFRDQLTRGLIRLGIDAL